MKKKRPFAGYQVRSEDLKSISFSSYSLEDCKKYCRDGYVVVSTYHKRFGIKLNISLMEWYKPFQFVWNMNRHAFNILWLHVYFDYLTHEKPDKVVWRTKP